MATAKAFLLLVVIDDTRDAEAHVPDEFRDVQWTRLPGGETPEKFCTRVGKLLGGSDVARAFQPVGVANTDTNRNTGWKARGTPEVSPRLPAAV